MGEASHGGRPTTQVDSEPDPATPGVDADESAAVVPPLRARGDAIGRYVVVDLIGQGGMGVVYAAWDPQLDRRVALKLVTLAAKSGGSGTEGDVHRLRLLREAQALARLEHANVVKVHDVGVCRATEPGLAGAEQVYIAMEYVAGESLREWLRVAKPRLRPLLTVFVAAGRGLAAAHRAGLVHRDFKPDNVLVGDEGEVKVVDFGLARDSRVDDSPSERERTPTSPISVGAGSGGPRSERSRAGNQASERPSGSTSITQTGALLGTPAYMAPEQHVRAAVDARCDQYAFCVALWEAVYGKRPFSGRRSDELAERKRALQLRESSRGLRVPSALRATLLRGLSVDPGDRFADMDELLATIEAQLAARRRRLVPAISLGLTLTLAAVAVGASVWLDKGATVCAAPTERLEGVWDPIRRQEVERVMMASDLAYASDTWTRVAAGLDDYRERWLAAEVEACEATHVHLERDAAWLEGRLACLDDRLRELGSLSDQLVRSDARTVEAAARAVGSLSPIETCERERATADLTPLPSEEQLRRRIEVELDRLADARALISSGHFDEGLAVAREVLTSEPARDWPALLGEARFVIGNVVGDIEGDPARERESLHEAARAALRGGHRRLAALSWSRLARGQVKVREFSEAERWLSYAVNLADALGVGYGEDPPLAADLEHTRAQLRFHQGDFPGAEAHAIKRLELLRELFGPDSPRVADGLNNLGVTVYMQGRRDEAVAAYREALTILERVQGPNHPSVANMHNNIGVVSTDRQRYAEALTHYRRALEIRTRVFPRGHELRIQSLVNLANVHLFSGDHAAGIEPALETLLANATRLEQDRGRALDPGEAALLDLQLIPDYLSLGRLFAGTEEHDNAVASFARALTLLDAAPDARLPLDFVVPAKGEPWPAHLDGCRADVLLGLETSSRALGRDELADWAAAEQRRSPVPQPGYPRRCLDELGGFMNARGQ